MKRLKKRIREELHSANSDDDDLLFEIGVPQGKK
jgi:hypothetical protein